MSSENHHCPRCGGTNLEIYEDSFDCLDCFLEFEVVDLETCDDDSNILSIEEKSDFIHILKSNWDDMED